ncbi:MAG TPA: pitrilysin family protein [Vicinamibacterales bacterium]
MEIEIPYTKVTLENGLDVLLHEDHSLPIVAVNIWYHVGSKNERPGLTGFAHLFEHLMFEGSAHHDKGYFPPLQEAGASLNGSTNADRTNYWEVVPTGALELALFLESDRMGYLLPALTEEKFATQREVVLNERRQNYENRPYGLASIALADALYPADHPYHWPTIGYPPDLRSASLDDVRAFFARYYHPANASLALAGDIEPESALQLVRKYFEEIPPGPRVDPVAAPPGGLETEARLVLEDRVELPRLYMAWRSPALFAEGDAACDVLADVLANGKTSRLYRRLVHQMRIALDVSAMQQSRELEGAFQLAATAAPGRTLAEIDAVVRDTLAEIAASGPTDDELARALAQAEAHFVYRLQTNGGFSGKSDQLNAYNTFRGDPGYFGQDLARYLRLTPAAVREAAAQLAASPRVVLSVVPKGHRELALPDSREAVAS